MKMEYHLLHCVLLVSFLVSITAAQNTGAVRLSINGQTSPTYTEGRVQVYYNGRWGNICNDAPTFRATTFSRLEADVVCRSLGYIRSIGVSTTLNDSYGIDISFPVITGVGCSLNSLHILACTFSTSISSRCSDLSDVGVSCSSTRLWFDPYPGMIRLQGGNYSNEGVVEVYCDGEWGTICGDHSLTSSESEAICNQLGYRTSPGFTSIPKEADNVWFSPACTFTSSVCCSSNCSTVIDSNATCISDNSLYIYCAATSRFGVATLSSCDTMEAPSGTGAVRLVRNGSTSLDYNSGRVQIYINGVWSNICRGSTTSPFTMSEANVICHQLDYANAVSWSYGSVDNFGIDLHLNLVTDVQCSNSRYLALRQCTMTSNIYVSCNNNDEISVTCTNRRLTDDPYPGMVRLAGSEFVSEGRVEVYYNGQWGTICNVGFGTSDVGLVCSQLGYSSGIIVTPRPGNDSMPIWLSSLTCSVFTDSCLYDCAITPSVPIVSSLCTHSNDATIECFSNSVSRSSTVDDCRIGNSPGSVVLYRNGSESVQFNSGRVVLRFGSGWGNVCRLQRFGSSEADVICQQLTYSGASSWSYTSIDNFGVDSRNASISNVTCATSAYISLLQCSYSSTANALCDDSNDVSVTCYTQRIWDNPFPGMIRLVNGRVTNEGRVEVYCNGQWGTVCDSTFGIAAANTVCRQLGYTHALQYEHRLDPGNMTQPIWFNDLNCVNGDNCLINCQRCPAVATTDCSHFRDVSIRCYHIGMSSLDTGALNSCMNSTRLPVNPAPGNVILTRNGVYSKSYTSGRVVAFGVRSSSGNICRFSSFGINEANTICRQLTYTGASSWSYAAVDLFGFDARSTIFSDVSCSSDYLTLFQCSAVNNNIQSSCTDDNDVSVTCYSTHIWDNPFPNMVRLRGGNYTNEGIVEIYCNEGWGSVCSLSSSARDVVCNQLGYALGQLLSSSLGINSTAPIWHNHLDCERDVRDSVCISQCGQCQQAHSSACTLSRIVQCSSRFTSANRFTATLNRCKVNVLPTVLGSTLGIFGGIILIALFIMTCLICIRCDPNYRHNPTLCTAVKDWVSNECPCLGYKYTSPPQRLRQTTPLPPQDTSTTQDNSQQTFSNTSTAFTATTSTYNTTIELNVHVSNGTSNPSPRGSPSTVRAPPPEYNPEVASAVDDKKTIESETEFNKVDSTGINGSGFRDEEPPPYDPNWS